MQRQRHQSVIRVWRSNYISFILERSKITHRGRCSTNGVWGSWSWLFSPHDGDSSNPCITNMPYEQDVTVANLWLCKWRDCQLDMEPCSPLLPRVSVLFTSIPFKCSVSITLILTYNRTSVKVSKRAINNI